MLKNEDGVGRPRCRAERGTSRSAASPHSDNSGAHRHQPVHGARSRRLSQRGGGLLYTPTPNRHISFRRSRARRLHPRAVPSRRSSDLNPLISGRRSNPSAEPCSRTRTAWVGLAAGPSAARVVPLRHLIQTTRAPTDTNPSTEHGRVDFRSVAEDFSTRPLPTGISPFADHVRADYTPVLFLHDALPISTALSLGVVRTRRLNHAQERGRPGSTSLPGPARHESFRCVTSFRQLGRPPTPTRPRSTVASTFAAWRRTSLHAHSQPAYLLSPITCAPTTPPCCSFTTLFRSQPPYLWASFEPVG